MGDLLEIFQLMHQKMQLNDFYSPRNIHLPGNISIRKLSLMKEGPIPGKKDSKFIEVTEHNKHLVQSALRDETGLFVDECCESWSRIQGVLNKITSTRNRSKFNYI